MKKILLSLGLFSLVLVGKSQTVLNEIYTDPGNNKSEFFELYNSSTAVGGQSVDCFTILTYVNTGNNGIEGWYVMDLPNLTIGPKGFFTGASASPFNTQSLTGVTANFNWNSTSFRNGSTGGSLIFAQLNAARTAFSSVAVPNPLDDFLAGGNGQPYITLIFVNGVFSNGFIGGSNSGAIPSYVANMPTLSVSSNCGGSIGNFNINFATALQALENVVSQPGSDNGYARTSDGKCGAWVKTSASVQHTPGLTNGSATSGTSSLITTQVIQCGIPARHSTLNFDITGINGTEITELQDFPVIGQVYADRGTGGILDGADSLLGSVTFTTVAEAGKTLVIPQTVNLMVVYKTQRGCFDKVISVVNTCAPLPVGLSSFSASRNLDAVMVRWTTAFEQNNNGFAVERNTNGSWEQIGWVASAALNGNSSDNLSYSFVDRTNNFKSISQYRLRQVDIDTKATYSDIRTVRGDGQVGKITIYPNPSGDGKVNILFDDANVTRNISISDMSGRMIKEIRSISNNNITISNLQPGMYTVKIAVPETGEQVVQKIVVNKR